MTNYPQQSPLREATGNVMYSHAENTRVLTPRRSPRKRKSIGSPNHQNQQEENNVCDSPVRKPMASIPNNSVIVSTPTRRSPRKKNATAVDSETETDTVSEQTSLTPQIAELWTLDDAESSSLVAPPITIQNVHDAHLPEIEELNNFVLEYRHPSVPGESKRVRIVYDQNCKKMPSLPSIPPGKSILKKKKKSGLASLPSDTVKKRDTCDSPSFTVEDLNYRMSILFPDQQDTLLLMPCDAARLLACFTLHQDEEQRRRLLVVVDPKMPGPKAVTRRRKVSLDGKTPGIHSIQPIMPLMKEVVHLELVHNPSLCKKKVVHFPAFNGSALQPPSDVIEGSDQLREECIQQLTTVVQESHKLHTAATTSPSSPAKTILQQLVHYLKTDFVANSHAQACAHSFPSKSYPPARVAKAAKAYVQDLTRILHTDSEHNIKPCSWEFRLADLAAQHIRYWLRTLLNPIPDRAPATFHNKNWRHRVCDIVALQVNEGEESTAVEDGSLSSLVSDALSFLYEFFGTHRLQDFAHSDRLPDEFCSSTLSLKQLYIAPEQWLGLEQEMTTATCFLAAMNGVQFLRDLFAIIESETKYHKLWKQWVQESAVRLSLADSSSLQSEDFHLVLLKAPLEDILPVLENMSQKHALQYGECQHRLKDMSQRFLFGKKSKRKKRHQPYLERLEGSYLETLEKIQFPRAIRTK